MSARDAKNNGHSKETVEPSSSERLLYLRWITVFCIALDDMGTLIKSATDLNISQARFLYETCYQRGSNLTGEIATRLFLQPNTATAIINKLVDHGLIVQSSDTFDKRTSLLGATDKGKKTARVIEEALTTYQKRLKELLGKVQLEELLHFGAHGLKELHIDYQRDDRPLPMLNYLNVCADKIIYTTNVAKTYGVSLNELRVLGAVVTHSSAPRVSTLSSRLGLRPNVVTVALDKLEKLDCLRRTQDSEDKRAVRIIKTEAGSEIYREILDALIKGSKISCAYPKEIPLPVTAHVYARQRNIT